MACKLWWGNFHILQAQYLKQLRHKKNDFLNLHHNGATHDKRDEDKREKKKHFFAQFIVKA